MRFTQNERLHEMKIMSVISIKAVELFYIYLLLYLHPVSKSMFSHYQSLLFSPLSISMTLSDETGHYVS